MLSPNPVNELIEQVVALRRVRRHVQDLEERRRLARVIRQLRMRLGPGVPKHRAAAALGISPQALERWVRARAIPTIHKPGSSRELIDRDGLLRLVEETQRLAESGSERPVAKAVASLADHDRLRRRPRPNSSARELRYEYLHTTPAERLRTGVTLAQTAHTLASARQRAPDAER